MITNATKYDRSVRFLATVGGTSYSVVGVPSLNAALAEPVSSCTVNLLDTDQEVARGSEVNVTVSVDGGTNYHTYFEGRAESVKHGVTYSVVTVVNFLGACNRKIDDHITFDNIGFADALALVLNPLGFTSISVDTSLLNHRGTVAPLYPVLHNNNTYLEILKQLLDFGQYYISATSATECTLTKKVSAPLLGQASVTYSIDDPSPEEYRIVVNSVEEVNRNDEEPALVVVVTGKAAEGDAPRTELDSPYVEDGETYSYSSDLCQTAEQTFELALDIAGDKQKRSLGYKFRAPFDPYLTPGTTIGFKCAAIGCVGLSAAKVLAISIDNALMEVTIGVDPQTTILTPTDPVAVITVASQEYLGAGSWQITVNGDASHATTAGAEIYKYKWDVSGASLAGNASEFVFQWTASNPTVELTVTDTHGFTDSHEQTLTQIILPVEAVLTVTAEWFGQNSVMVYADGSASTGELLSPFLSYNNFGAIQLYSDPPGSVVTWIAETASEYDEVTLMVRDMHGTESSITLALNAASVSKYTRKFVWVDYPYENTIKVYAYNGIDYQETSNYDLTPLIPAGPTPSIETIRITGTFHTHAFLYCTVSQTTIISSWSSETERTGLLFRYDFATNTITHIKTFNNINQSIRGNPHNKRSSVTQPADNPDILYGNFTDVNTLQKYTISNDTIYNLQTFDFLIGKVSCPIHTPSTIYLMTGDYWVERMSTDSGATWEYAPAGLDLNALEDIRSLVAVNIPAIHSRLRVIDPALPDDAVVQIRWAPYYHHSLSINIHYMSITSYLSSPISDQVGWGDREAL